MLSRRTFSKSNIYHFLKYLNHKLLFLTQIKIIIMKKIYLLFIPFLAFALLSAITNGNQAPYGNTGSPGDGSNCTTCHSGMAQNDNNISTNIPASGYVPGTTYTITITATKANINKYGFQLTAENSTNSKTGTFVITDAQQTKLIQDEVTHTGLGTSASGNTKTWNVDWTAPATGTGAVTFYSAVNAANGDNGTGGDQILLSSLAIQEDLNTSISQAYREKQIKVFPSTADEYLNIQSQDILLSVRIFSLDGRKVFEAVQVNQTQLKVDVSAFESGVYVIHLSTKDFKVNRKFIRR
jgi:hypothetical protein